MSVEDWIAGGAFALVLVVLVVALIALEWSSLKHVRKDAGIQEHSGSRTGGVQRESLARSISKWIFAAMSPLFLLGTVLGIAIIGWRFLLWVVAFLVCIVVLLFGLVCFVRQRRMRYSTEGAAALARLVTKLKLDLPAGRHGVLDIQGIWVFDYPKVLFLFQSESAIKEAETSGLLLESAGKVTQAVRIELAFGRNRQSFDSRRAILATASKP